MDRKDFDRLLSQGSLPSVLLFEGEEEHMKQSALEALQKKLHLPFTVTDRDRFIEGVLRGRTFRVRYTILQYLYDRGLLERYAAEAYDRVMHKHFYGTFREQFPDWES